jgi:SAM-dependent methyltransferase
MPNFANAIMKKFKDNWFKGWFNSDYYHLLYAHRDFEEAENFISTLMKHLESKEKHSILDLACGKGRHAVHLNQLGYDVLGIDLSEESIQEAKKFENENLKFQQGDMRELNLDSKVDLVLNLFTSFGYFSSAEEDQKAIDAMSQSLKSEGLLVIDYLNVHKIIEQLPTEELVKRKGIDFHINKHVEDGFIVKDIEFKANEQSHHYQEFVKCLDLNDFEAYLENGGLSIKEVFGSYQLDDFNKQHSDRLILIAEKKS